MYVVKKETVIAGDPKGFFSFATTLSATPFSSYILHNSIMVRMSANRSGHWGSIPGHHTKDTKNGTLCCIA